MTPQTFSCCEADRVELICLVVLFCLDFPSYKCKLSNSPGILMLGVDNCGFMLCPSENNQNQQQGQFLFCFCFKYQRQLFYASNTTEKALKKYQIMGVKSQFFWLLLFIYFILLLLLLFFFLGGGAFLFCFICCCCFDTTLNLPSIMNKPIKLATSVNNFHNSLHCLF